VLTKRDLIVGLTCFFFLFSVALAQQAKKPLSLEDIEQLFRIGVSSKGVTRLLDERGVNFEVTEDVKERLRKAGADATVMQAVEGAGLEFARRRYEKERQKAGVDVAKVQRLLKALGFDPGLADGVAGARTRDAIRSFQRSAGLRPEGEISNDLVRRLELEHDRRKLEEEQRKVEEEGRRLKEERRRVEREKRRAQDRRRKPAAPSPGVLSSSPTPSGYRDVEVPKIVSGAFVNELQNKKVKVLVNYFVVAKTNLTPQLAAQFIPFNALNYNKPSGFLTVLVPKRMADRAFEVPTGQIVALYGQLVPLPTRMTAFTRPATRWTKELVLMIDRIEP